MGKTEKIVKLGATALCELFAAFTVVTLLEDSQPERMAMALGTLVLALLPALAEKLLRCRFCLPLYLFALFYSVGPMLGSSWKLYYTFPVWDKLLHISGGVMFAILGAYLFKWMTHGEKLDATTAVFALCFSMAVAVLWEFVEFGADVFLGMDMQDDVVIHSMTSYLLGEGVGVTGRIPEIRSVAVNGATLPVDGYIDIGLIDSMLDMLLETLGAVVTCVFLWLDKGRHTLIEDCRKKTGS